jgi:hypothetical protein
MTMVGSPWILAGLLSLVGTGVAWGQSATQRPEYQSALDGCARTFDYLAALDESWVFETLCELPVEGGGIVEFRVSKISVSRHRNDFLVSDLLGYAALYAPDGFYLQPTTDPATFRLGAKAAGQHEFIYLHEEFGGVYSYAHFVDRRAIWVRCNEVLVSCVYYDELLVETPITDRWGIQRSCSFRWSVSFPAPTADAQVSTYLASILPFTADFATINADRLVPACLRPGQRQPEVDDQKPSLSDSANGL